VDDLRLAAALAAAADTERAIRFHLEQARGQAFEQARGQVAYRNAVGLRKALEDWISAREYRATHPATSA
jgi:hypothetical protein